MMKTSRYAVSRRKACQECFHAKAKCHRLPELTACRRCRTRNVSCSYAGDDLKAVLPAYRDSLTTDKAAKAHIPSRAGGLNAPAAIDLEGPSLPEAKSSVVSSREHLDFSDLRLTCTINADDISNRWLNSYIPTPQQKPKAYPANVTTFISRVLNSYVGMTMRRRAPPFVHETQLLPPTISEPLATCLGLVRMCEEPLPGSEAPLTEVLERQMSNLYEWRGIYDNATLLAAFQAYLIYSMLLFFRLNQSSNALLRQAMMSLQELACASVRQGLVCREEQHQTRPRWESWIVAEAKRRTLYTMYLFDSVLLVHDNLPTFLASEIHGLLAPGSKTLWNSQSRQIWEKEYNQQLAGWPQGILRIEELWPIPADLDDFGVADRRRRVDQWLENVDEYGTMMYTVTSCTHGG